MFNPMPKPIKKAKTPKKAIRNKSKKLADLNKIYLYLRKIFLEKTPVCEIKRPGICTHYATEIHHKAGRIGWRLVYVPWFCATCGGGCHAWASEHSKEAIELGHSLPLSTPKPENADFWTQIIPEDDNAKRLPGTP